MYYPYGRQQYYPRPVYQPPQYRPPQYYQPYAPQYYPQSALYQSYNGYPIPKVNMPTAHPMASQTIQSPNKNFQSPMRGFASPARNQLMQSQQQQPPQYKPPSQQQLQSPTRPGFLTYEQVMERINKNNIQQQSHLPQQKSTSLPQPIKPLPQNGQIQQQQPKKKQDHEIQPTQQQTQQQNKTPNKQVHEQQEIQPKKQQTPPPQQLENEEVNNEPEELALQYEDGYIYRGQGYPPQTRNGFGILTDSEGQEVYAGYWKDNFYEGDGKLNNLQIEELEDPYDYTNMTNIGNGWLSYEGEFEGGKMHGQGTLILSNREKYTGQFDDGMIHGEGQFQTLEGKIIQAKWEQGILEQYIE
ncbi:unnamed protein product [Paramecium sonneborni]|uniref:MORN repeat protein n=1 Tax=Paramecium sonneborni TaxID=65129 RepID=A0A8S1K183_9CILI|nr:unnamed protein product [Paramecium sonneborni]